MCTIIKVVRCTILTIDGVETSKKAQRTWQTYLIFD